MELVLIPMEAELKSKEFKFNSLKSSLIWEEIHSFNHLFVMYYRAKIKYVF